MLEDDRFVSHEQCLVVSDSCVAGALARPSGRAQDSIAPK